MPNFSKCYKYYKYKTARITTDIKHEKHEENYTKVYYNQVSSNQ